MRISSDVMLEGTFSRTQWFMSCLG